MLRMLGSVVVGLLAVGAARAHFPFVVPEPDGSAAKVVFSDSLKPDTNVNIEKVSNTKLTLRDAAGKETPLELKKGDGFYQVALPGSGPRVVYGVTDYGVRQKGDDKPFRLVYYPKAVIGAADGKAIGGVLKAEVVPVGGAGKVRFQVLAAGKPLPEAEVTVLPPAGEGVASKTDKEGLTGEFAAPGRYGVFARWTEPTAGEAAGMKFTETRHYATLVMDVK
jgi:uncharacterized GH25 family protein